MLQAMTLEQPSLMCGGVRAVCTPPRRDGDPPALLPKRWGGLDAAVRLLTHHARGWRGDKCSPQVSVCTWDPWVR